MTTVISVVESLEMSMLSETVRQPMPIQGTELTLHVPFLVMVVEATMQELLLKQNYISKQWRMTIVEISNGPVSIIC